MDAEGAAVALGQNREISAGLGCLHYAEGIFLLRYLQVRRVVAGDLQEDSTVGAAFVALPRGMQKARAKAEAGRSFLAIPYAHAQCLQKRLVLGIHLDICQHSKIEIRSGWWR